MVPGIRVGGINFRRIVEYAREHPEDFAPGLGVPPGDFDGENMASVQGITGWYSLVKKGIQNGDFPSDLVSPIGRSTPIPSVSLQINPLLIKRGIAYLIGAHLSQSFRGGILYPWNAEDVTIAQNQALKRARLLVSFLQKHIPGFENCYLLDVSPTVGPQDTRRIVGEYMLTREDIRQSRTFHDEVCLVAMLWPDVPVIEYSGWMMHAPIEENVSKWLEVFLNTPRFETVFGVPYRCLIPKGFDGILVAGQTISMTYMAHEPGPCRGMPFCMQTGQAAGTAAAIAVKQKTSLKEVDPSTLRSTLESQGVNLRRDLVDLSEHRKRVESRGMKIVK
jgi:hypothetical protein